MVRYMSEFKKASFYQIFFLNNSLLANRTKRNRKKNINRLLNYYVRVAHLRLSMSLNL